MNESDTSSLSEFNTDSGSEYTPSGSSSTASLVSSDENHNHTEAVEEFSVSNGYELKEITKKSTHKVWGHFGCLYKTNKIVQKTKDRVFCKKCFEKNVIKR